MRWIGHGAFILDYDSLLEPEASQIELKLQVRTIIRRYILLKIVLRAPNAWILLLQKLNH